MEKVEDDMNKDEILAKNLLNEIIVLYIEIIMEIIKTEADGFNAQDIIDSTVLNESEDVEHQIALEVEAVDLNLLGLDLVGMNDQEIDILKLLHKNTQVAIVREEVDLNILQTMDIRLNILKAKFLENHREENRHQKNMEEVKEKGLAILQLQEHQ
jgi:hypothetical protein